MNIGTALTRALSADALKLRRTLALWMVLIAPMTVNLIVLLNFIRVRESLLRNSQLDVWTWFARNAIGFWGLLMLPLFVALETALLNGIEHSANGWKHLFSLPVPRWAIYLSKQIFGLGLLAAADFVLLAGVLASGGLVMILGLRADLAASTAIPWSYLMALFVPTYFASWLMVAIHVFVSMRWQSFTVPLGLGMVATVAGFMIANSRLWAALFPWTLPIASVRHLLGSAASGQIPIVLGCLGGVLAILLAGLYMTRRDVA